MPNSQPTRPVKVRVSIDFKGPTSTSTLVEQVVVIDVPINLSREATLRDTRFVMALERAKERLMDEHIKLNHQVHWELKA